jgi:hypothetical protein
MLAWLAGLLMLVLVNGTHTKKNFGSLMSFWSNNERFSNSIYIFRAYKKKYSNFGPGGWANGLQEIFNVQFNLALDRIEKPPISIEELSRFTSSHPKMIIYQMPELYLDDMRSTNGAISQFASRIFHSPFIAPLNVDFSFANMTKLCDNPASFAACNAAISTHKGKCVFLPPCSHNAATDIVLGRRPNIILYLKTYAGNGNEDIYRYVVSTVVPALTAKIEKRFPTKRVVTFEYGFYEGTEFLETARSTMFAVIYSPGETMGLFHVELRARGVPLFVLEPRSVPHFFRHSVSGTIVNSRLALAENKTEDMIVKPFVHFMDNIDSFNPIDDLRSYNLLYDECGNILKKIAL